ncbi:MAG: hypothetical protein L3K10_04150 [Thermoplasmata archaeon]|nr:hypothetical protein [Thermoplasmata archaeon]
MVDVREWMGAIDAIALGLLLFRQLYPAQLPPSSRLVLDATIGVLMVVAIGLVLKLVGLL